MPRDFERALLVTVQLYATAADERIVQRAVTATGQAIFVPPLITQAFDNGAKIVELYQVGNNRHQVENWLGANAWNGGRTNVMHRDENVTEHSGKARCFAARLCRPSRIVLLEFYRYRRRHLV